MHRFKEGDKVNYRPVGGALSALLTTYITKDKANCKWKGANSHTNKSVGVIREIMTGRSSTSDHEPRYKIENMNTHKSSSIKEGNIEGPAE